MFIARPQVISHAADEAYDTSSLAKNVVNFTADEQRRLGEALGTLAREIAMKRLELSYMFKDQDKQNRGYISRNNFIRVISSANIVTSQVGGARQLTDPSTEQVVTCSAL
jgi:Ca2+-binding EF-hand superfamily protein